MDGDVWMRHEDGMCDVAGMGVIYSTVSVSSVRVSECGWRDTMGESLTEWRTAQLLIGCAPYMLVLFDRTAYPQARYMVIYITLPLVLKTENKSSPAQPSSPLS